MFTPEFLAKYQDRNPFPNTLSEFVYLRTYSRWLEDKGRRETWLETCTRCVQYSYSLYRGPASPTSLKAEAEQSLDDMFNLRQLPSGRTMWVGGTDIIEQIPTANYNCSFVAADSLTSFHDMFYLLMVGCGVGFSTEQHHIEKLPLFNKDIQLKFSDYKWNQSYEEDTITYTKKDNSGTGNFVTLKVGDSREGWSVGLLKFLEILADPETTTLRVNLNNIRPQGERLKRFGGKASGPEPYKTMLKMIHQIISEAPDVATAVKGSYGSVAIQGMVALRPIDVLDIGNVIGQNVVAGGVRRTAEIALFDADNQEMLAAKDEFWADPRTQHRNMSNNSIMFWKRPELNYLNALSKRIQNSYEPGFINAEAASLRRTNFAGVNPCAEILLANRGFCNLATVFVTSTLTKLGSGMAIDIDLLVRLVRQATRHCARITNVDIELPEWDKVQKRDRLLGVNPTGIEDAIDAALADVKGRGDDPRRVHVVANGQASVISVSSLFTTIRVAANAEATRYAAEMGINRPLLVTTVQPSGTLSQLASCSSGFHRSFAPFFIRRVRINSFDALAKTVRKQGYKIYPESQGQGWKKLPAEYRDYVASVTGKTEMSLMNSQDFDKVDRFVQDMILDLADTWVVEFVVKTHAKSQAADESAISQLNRYFNMQRTWTDHNTSATIQVGNQEWDEVMSTLHQRWDDYIGVSFQNKSNDKYDLAPYEAITEAEYNSRISNQVPIDLDLLTSIENGSNSADDELDAGCATGSCPVR